MRRPRGLVQRIPRENTGLPDNEGDDDIFGLPGRQADKVTNQLLGSSLERSSNIERQSKSGRSSNSDGAVLRRT